jgi:hypothetical protein
MTLIATFCPLRLGIYFHSLNRTTYTFAIVSIQLASYFLFQVAIRRARLMGFTGYDDLLSLSQVFYLFYFTLLYLLG